MLFCEVLADPLAFGHVQTQHGFLLHALLGRKELLLSEPVAAEHGVDELEVREFFEHAAEQLAAHGRGLVHDATELTAQIRPLDDGLIVDRQRGVMNHDRDVHVVQNLQIGFEGLIIEIDLTVMAGQLHADHSELLQTALELVEVLLAAPGRENGVRKETAVRTPAHVGGLVVDEFAGIKPEPLLPDRDAKQSDVDAGVVHRLELGLE